MAILRLKDISVIHASPPCQGYSAAKSLPNSGTYPLLISEVRDRLKAAGIPWVLENVEGARAEMESPLTLCGSMFGLGSGEYQLRRHRLFESSVPLSAPGPCQHTTPVVSVVGEKARDRRRTSAHPDRGTTLPISIGREAMGIDWMTAAELCEAIPPAYTEHVGRQLA